jgi:glyoxylase-like metal-dependent hydrolase (beta-lactamase superfamily II)
LKFNNHWFALEGVTQYFLGENFTLNPVVGVDDRGLVLIDTGGPGSIELLEHSLKGIGFALGDVKWVIATHHHFDHVGNLNELVTRFGATSLAHKIDASYITGEKERAAASSSALDLEQMKKQFPKCTENDLKELESGTGRHVPPLPSQVGKILHGGEVLHIAGGIQVIHTPGHTGGHISLFIPSAKLLVPGDLMSSYGRTLQGPSELFSDDYRQAWRSMWNLSMLNMDIENMACYHGDPILSNGKEAFDRLISEGKEKALIS